MMSSWNSAASGIINVKIRAENKLMNRLMPNSLSTFPLCRCSTALKYISDEWKKEKKSEKIGGGGGKCAMFADV